MNHNKRIVATIDDQTCLECLRYDGLDPDVFGMPPCLHDDSDDDQHCRCVVRGQNFNEAWLAFVKALAKAMYLREMLDAMTRGLVWIKGKVGR